MAWKQGLAFGFLVAAIVPQYARAQASAGRAGVKLHAGGA